MRYNKAWPYLIHEKYYGLIKSNPSMVPYLNKPPKNKTSIRLTMVAKSSKAIKTIDQ